MGDKGNTVGRLYGQAAMSNAPASSANPPVKAETPEEEGWLSKWWGNTKHELSEAADHPWEATKGAVKGIANIPSDIGELLIKGSTLQTAGQMEQAAAMQSVFGQTQSAEALMQGAQEVKASAGSIELPKFQMSNAAQAGGDKIATAASLLAGGAGLAKGGVRGMAALGKVGAAEGAELTKTASAAGKVLKTEGAVAEGTKAADATADATKATKAAEGAGAGKATGDGAKILRNGYSYEFDAQGRVSKVGGKLKLNKTQGRNVKAQREAGGVDRLPDDQGGHYIGRRFDGPTDDFNHFAQNGNFNNGAYKSLENSWQRSIEQGKSVEVEIAPTYAGESLRPSAITVRQWIDGVPSDPIKFGNNIGGKLN